MATSGQDYTFRRGEKRTLRFAHTDVDVAGSPAKDISAFDLKWAMQAQDAEGVFAQSPVVLEKASGGDGITVSGGDNENGDVALVGADTANLPVGPYHHQFSVFEAGEEIVTASGTITLEENLSNTL